MIPADSLNGAKLRPKKRLFCAFCAQADDKSEMMVAGHCVCICAACVDLCAEIVQTHRATWAGDAEYASWVVTAIREGT